MCKRMPCIPLLGSNIPIHLQSVCRSIVFSSVCINLLPLIFGYDFVWYTVTVSEGICAVIAVLLCRISEKNGIVYR